MIELSNISKTYGTTTALRSVSLEVQAAKTTVLIGPSGCGKSTLIRTIIGLIPPDIGQVKIENELLTLENMQAIRQKVGYVIQDGGLFPHLTAKDNILLLSRYLKRDEKKSQERLLHLAELTKLPPSALDRFPTQLSGGQKQRVGIIRALMLDPDILLLDEPMGALDPMIRSELQQDLRDIFKSLKKTVVMVTHDLGEAFFLGHEIVLMKSGEIVQLGSARDLTEHPASPFVTQFVNAQRSHLQLEEDSP